MSYLSHIHACNRHDLGKFRAFSVAGQWVGWVRHDVAQHLAAYPETFKVSIEGVSLNPALDTPAARTEAVERVAAGMARSVGTPALRGERYRVSARFGDPELMSIDRGVVSLFGIRAYGVHVNGLVRHGDGLSLWIGRRAMNKSVAPGKLDNMVAGGQPAGLTLLDNVIKEAAEEAAVPAALAATARPVGAIAYCLEDAWGLKPDVMFCWDLEVPRDFTPVNTDGELQDFTLMPVAEVARMVRDTDEFKFNVNLVIIDFLIRNGLIHPDTEADYAELVCGLRRGW